MEKLMKMLTSKDTWFQFYDMIRVIELGGTHRVMYCKGNGNIDVSLPCYNLWNRNEACSNCISKGAFEEDATVIKFEYRDGTYYLVQAKAIVFEDKKYLLEVILNVTKQMTSEHESFTLKDLVKDISERLDEATSKEAFTNLYNKSHMIDIYNNYKGNGNKKIYMCLLDIDNFKLVNDIYGHDLGDKAILTIADILSKYCSEDGDVARFGGDEFGVVFSGTDEIKYKRILRQIKEELDNIEYIGEDSKFHITISYGMADVGNTSGFSEAVHLVDKELYYAKRKSILDKDKVK